MTNDLSVFASCGKRSGLLVGGTIDGFDLEVRSWFEIVTRVIEW